MDHIRGTDFRFKETCVAFGRFDGIHVGHRAVIRKTVELADRCMSSVLLSLDFQPCGLFGQETILYTEDEKARLLSGTGLDLMVSYPFTKETADGEAKEFIKKVLVGTLGARIVVAGTDCKFGKGRKGDADLLKHAAAQYGFEVVLVDMVGDGEGIVTDERVRAEISASNLDSAAELLGHPYTVIGPVKHGKALGRTAKMPTANVGFDKRKLIPPHGIYVTLTRIDGEPFRGLTIIGTRPTVDNFPYVTIETYLLDFSRDIYGKKIHLEIRAYVREIRKFRDLFEAKEQVDRDIESVREYLATIR